MTFKVFFPGIHYHVPIIPNIVYRTKILEFVAIFNTSRASVFEFLYLPQVTSHNRMSHGAPRNTLLPFSRNFSTTGILLESLALQGLQNLYQMSSVLLITCILPICNWPKGCVVVILKHPPPTMLTMRNRERIEYKIFRE